MPTRNVQAATCPFIDNDANDGDATVGTYELNINFSVPAAATVYDCTSAAGITTFIVPNTRTLTLDSNTVTGAIAAINFTNLQIDNGGIVSANGKGCAVPNGAGSAPNGSNICTIGATGSGVNGNQGGAGGHGGAGGAGNSGGAGGGTYDSATAPVLFGASGASGVSSTLPGAGGGVVRLNITGTFTHDGVIAANGLAGAGGGNAAGGGAGGSIFITAATINGSTGVFSANGGTGGDGSGSADGGGGGGGRIAITYTGGSFGFDSADFTATGAAGGSPGGFSGAKGTVYIKDTAASRVDIFHGFTYTDTDFNETTWIVDASATNQYCATSGSATPSVTAANLTFGGTLNCTTGLSSFNLSASTDFGILSGTVFTVSAANADVDWNIPIGDDQTWTNVTVTTPSQGDFIIDDDVAITLSGSTAVNANVKWTALTDLSLSSASSISASGRGCPSTTGGAGFGPNGSNVCSQGGTGSGGSGNRGGGGGHGGAGGAGNVGGAGGPAYDSATAPVLFGASGGKGVSAGASGAGGGAIRLSVSGIFSNNGTIAANATSAPNGGNPAGGGAGGSIYITVGTYTCTTAPTIAATGGDGGNSTEDGGGGGGGRVRIEYAADTCSSSPLAGLTASSLVPGGSGWETAVSGGVGSLSVLATNPPPTVTVVSHSPANPFTTDSVTLSGTATDNAGVTKIEIYLDGTAPGNLKHTCIFAPAETPASCQINVGQLSNGGHTTTIMAYDDILQVGQGTENFSVGGSTLSGQLFFSRSKVSVSSSFTLSFALSGTSTGTLTVTFPVQFTVTAGGSGGASSACLSSFGFTSTTMTATKTNCSGTVVLGGATVTNPSTPGEYIISWTNDSGSGSIFITSDDQAFVTAAVDPVLTFNVGSQASATACAGSFAGNGGTVPLGALTTSTVASSDAASIPHICTRLTTNAVGGSTVTVRSLNASLRSTSVPGDTIPSSTTTLSPGTAGYGICAGSAGADSGMDVTTPAGTAPTRSSPFNGTSCTSTGHDVGGLSTSQQNIWTVAGPTQNAFMRIYVKAGISSSTPAHSDYTDTLTFVATGTY